MYLQPDIHVFIPIYTHELLFSADAIQVFIFITPFKLTDHSIYVNIFSNYDAIVSIHTSMIKILIHLTVKYAINIKLSFRTFGDKIQGY